MLPTNIAVFRAGLTPAGTACRATAKPWRTAGRRL